MMNFLHTFSPNPIFLQLGSIKIHWYGVFIVTGILISLFVVNKLAEKYDISKDTLVDLAFWLIINGIIGARIYHIFLELPYYAINPLNMIKVWQGGLAIHGGIIAGTMTLLFFVRKHKIDFWNISALIVPMLALSQAIGRWGNYFNQELFGKPTDLPWGIPINETNRIPEFYNYAYYHPTFLYESIGNFLIFIILFTWHLWIIKKDKKQKSNFQYIVLTYLILYSILRFSLEFIRIDHTPEFIGLRWPQVMSIIIVIGSVIFLIFSKLNNKKLTSQINQ